MSKKSKTTIVLIAIIVGVVGLMSGCSSSNKGTEVSEIQEEIAYIPVEIEKASVDSIKTQGKFFGKVFPNNEIFVMPGAAGIVSDVNVKVGDHVEKGDTIFSIKIAQGPGSMVQKVKSPITGVVASLNVKEDQIATNSQAAATIVDTDKVYVQINVVEDIVNKLQVGQEVDVRVPAVFNEYITSTISSISPIADPRSQLYPIKVYIDNVDENIRSGMTGEVRLDMDRVDSAIVIKGSAVLDRDGKKIVYVVEDNKAVEKVVTVGLDTGDYIEIKEGIKEGDSVIVEGQHYVENGEVVKVVRGE